MDSFVFLGEECFEAVDIVLFESDGFLEIFPFSSEVASFSLGNIIELFLQIDVLCFEVIDVHVHQFDVFIVVYLSLSELVSKFCHFFIMFFFQFFDLFALFHPLLLQLSQHTVLE